MLLLLVANASGLRELEPHIWPRMQEVLAEAGLGALPCPQARVGLLPRLSPTQSLTKSTSLPFRDAPEALQPELVLTSLVHDKAAVHWNAKAAVYTDGSKRDSSLSFAWVCPAESMQGRYQVPGPASEVKTILQAELSAIHAAVQALNADGNACIMTDSLCSLRLLVAHIARPDSLRHHKQCS